MSENPPVAEREKSILDNYVSSSTRGRNLSYAAVKAALQSCCTRRVRVGCREDDCPGKERVALEFRPAQTCGIAICEHEDCIGHRRNGRLKKYRPFTLGFKNAYFLTLTLQGHYEPNKMIAARLNHIWQLVSLKLRREHIIRGYLKVLEVAEDEYFDDFLEPVYVYTYHFHIVIDVIEGRRIDINEVRSLWVRHTHSPIMKIEKVQSIHQLVRYVTTYCTKATYFTVDIRTYLSLRKMKFFSSWQRKTIDRKTSRCWSWAVYFGQKRPRPERFVLLCPFCRSVFGYLGTCSDDGHRWHFFDYEALKAIT